MEELGDRNAAAVVLDALPPAPDAGKLPDEDVEVALESLTVAAGVDPLRRHKMAMLDVRLRPDRHAAIFSPINPYDPLKIPGAHHPGGDSPTSAHWFGTDGGMS